MTLKPDTGRYLARLRDEAGLKQNELAKRVEWSPAVLSRIESGERPVSTDEIESILDAIGSDKAKEFKMTHDREWREIERPVLGHPDEGLLWEADTAIHDVKLLLLHPDTKVPFGKRLEEIEGGLRDAANLVRSTEHAIAFVGDIGVGKTTSICRTLGLEIRDDEMSKSDAVLEVGAGGVTVCEVHITHGPDYGIFIEPMSDAEVRREVGEFANLIKSPPQTDQDSEEPIGTSKEIERAIRNMSELIKIRHMFKEKDGKTRRETEDPVEQLADVATNADALAVEILARMNLADRNKRELWYSPTENASDPLDWLKQNFRSLNNGRHPEFSIPRRMEIITPDPILNEKSLSIRIIDTKGIDGNARRGDIENLFGERNTVSILCSDFNSVPSPSVQQLLKRASDVGYGNIKNKAAILGLPKHNEALAVKDDDGTPAEDAEDGYYMKGEQAANRLASLGTPSVPVEFFNAFDDDPERLRSFMLERVRKLRNRNADELKQIIEDARELVDNYEREQNLETQRVVARQLNTWLINNRTVDLSMAPGFEQSLMDSISVVHASTLRASVRREGDWHNLDYSHELSFGARLAAVRVVSSKRDELTAITNYLLQDSESDGTSGLVRQVQRVVDTGVAELYGKCALAGEVHYGYLKQDSNIWHKSDREWGRGPGYKGRVSKHHTVWFNDWLSEHSRSRIADLIEEEWTSSLDRASAILDDALSD